MGSGKNLINPIKNFNMKTLKVSDKKITLKTFEKIVKLRQKEFSTHDTDVLAMQFINDVRTINNVGPDVASEFFKIYGNNGTLSQAKAAKNFVQFVLHGEKLYN